MTDTSISVDQIKTVGVIGAGTMGSGIAQVAAQCGHAVILVDLNTEAVERGVIGIKRSLQKLSEKNKISDNDAKIIANRIQAATTLEALHTADLVIEAIIEDLDVKRTVFSQLESICANHTILTSNTSSISITAIAASLKNPGRLAGFHFFNPATVMKLIEVVYGLATSDQVVDTLTQLGARWGKVSVAVKSSPGFIVNRVARPFYAEGLRLVQEGATEPAMVDYLVRNAGGFRMGPFELTDLIGQDVNYAVTCSVYGAYFEDPRFKPSLIQKELVDAGWLGRKSGRGFYHYVDGRTVEPELNWIQSESGEEFEIREVINSVAIAGLIEHIKAKGISIPEEGISEEGEIVFSKGARLMLTNGKTTLERCKVLNDPAIIQMDLALDYSTCSALAISFHPEIPDETKAEVFAFFKAMNINITVIKDLPGLVVMRIVCMLINEASDALYYGISSQEGIDSAMCSGLNYPKGLFSWADAIGISTVFKVLDNLNKFYEDGRYRISPVIKINHIKNSAFYAD